MRHWFRTLFLCLLLMTLPIQSVAGVARYQCAMAHGGSVDDSPLQDPNPGPAMQTSPAIAHGNGGAWLADDNLASDDECSGMRGHKGANCGTCPGCCIGSYAPPPVFTLIAGQDTTETAAPESTPSFTGHVPPRLERPPRSSLPHISPQRQIHPKV